jgi:hypothetical protein
MPTITLTPGSSTPSIISLTFDAGAQTGTVGLFDAYRYIVEATPDIFYWANSSGTPQPGQVQALDPLGEPITSALKLGVRVSVIDTILADFIQAGNNYVVNDTSLGTYTWCNPIGIRENPPVDAAPYVSMTATRYGIVWPIVDLLDSGGGSGSGTGTGTGTGTDTGTGTGTDEPPA